MHCAGQVARDNMVVCDIAAWFQGAVVDTTGGVVVRDRASLGGLRERTSPQSCLGVVTCVREEEHATHALACRIAGPNHMGG